MSSPEPESNLAPEPRPLHKSIAKIAPYFRGHGFRIALVAVVAVAMAAFSAFEPLAVKALFDRLLGKSSLRQVFEPIAVLGGLLLTREVLSAALDRLVWRIRLGANFELLSATVERLHALPLAYHRERGVGATMNRIDRGISGAMSAFSELLVTLLPSLVYLSVSVIVMLGLEWRLSLAVLALAPLPALLGALASREQVAREQTLLARWTRVFSRFNEVLSGIVVVKSFVAEDREKRRFLHGVADANDVVMRGVRTDSRTTAAKNAVMALARLFALGLGALLIVNDEISVGTLVAFVGYLGGLFQPIQNLTGMYQTFRRASVALETVIGILDEQDSLGDAPDAREVGRLRGEVEFRDVTFEYRPGHPVVKGLNLRARPGEMIALVGPSGAGKSTLMALLQRLYDPTQGSILLDGQDLRELKQRSVRQQIGVVLQDGMLFSDSVRDNVAFGDPAATLQEIEAVSRAANAHEFIERLQEGYDSQVGERGCMLSGGERQRVAIARALLKDAPILILDEATSALDAESEACVQEALGRLTQGRTTFVIAHRLSTVVSADRIVVLKDGGIAEIGTHRDLCRQNGYYATLIRKQTGGLLDAA